MALDVSLAPQGKMTAEQFTYWLQGFVELTDGTPPTREQWHQIEEHLQLVFTKVTKPSAKFVPPSYFVPPSALEQARQGGGIYC